jgi:hypothetical protein
VGAAGAGVGAGLVSGAGAGAGAGAGSCWTITEGLPGEKLGTPAPITCEDKPAVRNKDKREIFFMVKRGVDPRQFTSTSHANERPAM